jgi:hypothetical protein
MATAPTPQSASTLKEVADRKRVSLRTIYSEVSAGRLKISKIGARTIVYAEDEAAYDDLVRSEADARRNALKSEAA